MTEKLIIKTDPQPEVKYIPLTKGKFAIVDKEDFEKLNKYKWQASICSWGATFYATHGIRHKTGLRMHRVIMGAKPGQVVDHINHDCLDNRKANLRVCSQTDNAKNRLVSRNNKCGYKGICWCKRYKKWEATIYINGKNKWLGYFSNVRNAVIAYNDAARKHHGEFAYLNPI
jgi:hypothetical protein